MANYFVLFLFVCLICNEEKNFKGITTAEHIHLKKKNRYKFGNTLGEYTS